MEDGIQCHRRANAVHHLKSPRTNPELFVEPTNVKALCKKCHNRITNIAVARDESGDPGVCKYIETQHRISI
jgi:hypothetical protein